MNTRPLRKSTILYRSTLLWMREEPFSRGEDVYKRQALITILCLLAGIAFLSDFKNSYESMLTHGIYGSYQTELFRQYGETLEPDEPEEFDIPGKKAALIRQMDELILEHPIFSQNGVHNFEEYLAFSQRDTQGGQQEERFYDACAAMQGVLEQQKEGQTLDEWYDSPLMRYDNLLSLEQRYVNYQEHLETMVGNADGQRVVLNTVEKLKENRNANLIPYFLCQDVSLYAALVGVIAVLATLFLVSPLLVVDRSQNIHLLQYSSGMGRRVLGVQFGATMAGAFILSGVIVAAAYFALLSTFADDYWSARVMSFETYLMQLYNITFGLSLIHI